MKRLAITTASILLLAACAAGPQRVQYWDKAGGTQAEFDRTMASCRMRVAGLPRAQRTPDILMTPGERMSQAGRDLQEVAAGMGFMDDCLVSEGWTLRR